MKCFDKLENLNDLKMVFTLLLWLPYCRHNVINTLSAPQIYKEIPLTSRAPFRCALVLWYRDVKRTSNIETYLMQVCKHIGAIVSYRSRR